MMLALTSTKASQCALTEIDLVKAYCVLHEPESTEEKLKRINNLRTDFFEQNKGLELVRSDDSFILRFLRAAKFHHCHALKMLFNYHMRFKTLIWPEFLDKLRHPSTVKHVFDAGCVVCLKEKAIDGSAVCIARPGKDGQTSCIDFVAALVLSYEHLLNDEQVQIHGITCIYDLAFSSFQLYFQYIPVAKRMITLLQDAMPVRLKSANFVNESYLFHIVFSLTVRPLMKHKMRGCHKMHGKNFESLYEIIDPSVLPPAYGGTGDPLDGEAVDKWRDAVYGADSNK